MADLDLEAFDMVIKWTPEDEARPDVDVGEIPAALSERAQRVLRTNARLRGVFDGSLPINGDNSDSGRAYYLAIVAAQCGLEKGDAARLLMDFYGQPGKKKLHRVKLEKTLRAWAKGRDEAAAEEAARPAPAEHEEEPPLTNEEAPSNGNGSKGRKRDSAQADEPYDMLPAEDYRRASFTGAKRLVGPIGLTEGGVGLFTAPSGDGKSLFMLNAECAWAGVDLPLREVLPAVRPLRILGFEVENAPGVEQERENKILGTARGPAGLFLFTRTEPIQFSGPKGRPNERALARLGATLERFDPIDLVVFNPLVYLHQAEENSSSEMMRWLVPLREVCRRAGAAILVVHHAGWIADDGEARGRGTRPFGRGLISSWRSGRRPETAARCID